MPVIIRHIRKRCVVCTAHPAIDIAIILAIYFKFIDGYHFLHRTSGFWLRRSLAPIDRNPLFDPLLVCPDVRDVFWDLIAEFRMGRCSEIAEKVLREEGVFDIEIC